MTRFRISTDLRYGLGETKAVTEIIDTLRVKTVLVCVDDGVRNHSEQFPNFLNLLESKKIDVTVIAVRNSSEPDYDYIDEVARNVRAMSQIDLCIGIGGGSCLDLVKVIAVLKMNPGPAIDYRGFDKVQNPGVPTLLIPTTAGTGSEVTINASLIDAKQKLKLGINGRYMSATYSILDAEWTKSCPERALISAAMDALVHAVEGFSGRTSTRITRMFSKEGFALIFNNIGNLLEKNERGMAARQNMLMGSALAAMGLCNGGGGASCVLSYPVGVHFEVPHGFAGGIFLTESMRLNLRLGYKGYAELADLVIENAQNDVVAKSALLIDRIDDLFARIGAPKNFKDWNLTRKDLEFLMEHVTKLTPAFKQMPVDCDTQTHIRSVVHTVLQS